jgi:hypothetical protein
MVSPLGDCVDKSEKGKAQWPTCLSRDESFSLVRS